MCRAMAAALGGIPPTTVRQAYLKRSGDVEPGIDQRAVEIV